MQKAGFTLLNQLNERQLFAVTHTDGPMLILAGAGSGKTRTITHKIAYLIETSQCSPEDILAVTFTNKAAEEMKHRVQLLTEDFARPPLVSTFHSFGVRTLRRHADRIGYSPSFAICDTDDQKTVYRQVYQDLGLSTTEIPVAKVQALISRAKNHDTGPEDFLENHFRARDWPVLPLFRRYQELLKRANAVDFDDLILLTVQLLEENPEIEAFLGRRYRYLLIDEFQDTNSPQYRLIQLLTSQHKNVSAVGDEDQSIYRFRGADIRNILRFEQDYPDTLLVKLEENYRSTQVILDAATGVVSNNLQRKGKELWTRRQGGELVEIFAAEDARSEASFVCQRICQLHQVGQANVAILYRTNFQSRQFEESLRRLDIPYRLLGGISFYSRKEVKDALAYLRISRNFDDDVSLLRIINEPARGIGAKTVLHLQAAARRSNHSLWNAMETALLERSLGARAHMALARFREMTHSCRKHLEELPLHSALEKILETTGYFEHFEKQQTDEAEDRLANLRELTTVARDFSDGGRSLQEFLDEAALFSETDEYEAEEAVTLMTLHNAKGLEFRTVFIVGCEEGLFPHARSVSEDDLEEERRLCYVGMTRAQTQLFMTYSRRRRFYGSDSEGLNEPSRFLGEVPSHLVRFAHHGQALRHVQSTRLPFHRKDTRPYRGRTYNSKESVNTFLAKLSAKHRTTSGFTQGTLVEHPAFGRGRVLKVEDGQGDLRLTVQFPDGIRKLVQRIAKLRIV